MNWLDVLWTLYNGFEENMAYLHGKEIDPFVAKRALPKTLQMYYCCVS